MIRSALLAFLIIPLTSINAQLAAVPTNPAAIENAVATAILNARAGAHLRRLTRIPNRPTLRRIVCTAAATGTTTEPLLLRESSADSALLTLSATAALPPDVQRVAEYDDGSSARGRRITRFSVAAFPSAADPSLTWVGIALYWGRFTEYFATHVTQTADPPPANGSIAPACQALH